MTNPRKHPTERNRGGDKNGSVQPASQAKIVRPIIQIETVLEVLLETIQEQFYNSTGSDQSKRYFHRDRRQLLHALSWLFHNFCYRRDS